MKPINALTHAGLLAASLQNGRERYRYFLHSAVAASVLWGLHDGEGWVSLTDRLGHCNLPVWPSPVCARLCARGDWARCAVAGIDLHDFLEVWLSDMAALDVGVDVFATPLRHGFTVSARQLREHLLAHLADRNWEPPGDAGWQDTSSHSGAS